MPCTPVRKQCVPYNCNCNSTAVPFLPTELSKLCSFVSDFFKSEFRFIALNVLLLHTHTYTWRAAWTRRDGMEEWRAIFISEKKEVVGTIAHPAIFLSSKQCKAKWNRNRTKKELTDMADCAVCRPHQSSTQQQKQEKNQRQSKKQKLKKKKMQKAPGTEGNKTKREEGERRKWKYIVNSRQEITLFGHSFHER